MTILVLAPDPIVFGPPRTCIDFNCHYPVDELPSKSHDDIEQFLIRHRYLGYRDILMVDDD